MKNLVVKMVTALAVLLVAAGAQAMNMDHGSMKMDHSGMDMGGDMIMLEGDMQSGVMGMAHLRDISKKMAELGMDKTHHFMVAFTDKKKDKAVDKGLVAVKITDPSGTQHKAVKLMGMDGSFGADVALNQKGKYTFEVGTKLADGSKRQFTFQHMVH